jgi:hypothetical protein
LDIPASCNSSCNSSSFVFSSQLSDHLWCFRIFADRFAIPVASLTVTTSSVSSMETSLCLWADPVSAVSAAVSVVQVIPHKPHDSRQCKNSYGTADISVDVHLFLCYMLITLCLGSRTRLSDIPAISCHQMCQPALINPSIIRNPRGARRFENRTTVQKRSRAAAPRSTVRYIQRARDSIPASL